LEDIPETKYLTAKDAAEILGVHTATAIRYIDNGWLRSEGQLPGGRGKHQVTKQAILEFYAKMQGGDFQNVDR
jgi:predicted site-specific integrase-resolvase